MVTTTKATTTKGTKAKTDPIFATAQMVEKLTKGKAFPMIDRLVEEAEFHYFQIGGILAKVQEQEWWADAGFDTFKAFIEGKYGLKYRRAMHWVSIYRTLLANEIPWESVSTVGWSKLKEFADRLTLENVDEWVQRAEDMTVIQLQQYVTQLSSSKAKGDSEGDEEGGATPAPAGDVEDLGTLTFKVFTDQKATIQEAIGRAKEANQTDSAGSALEFICMAYIEGGLGKAKGASLEDSIEGKPIEEVLEAVEAAFPDATISVQL